MAIRLLIDFELFVKVSFQGGRIWGGKGIGR
jgi:hypothetical protein